MLLTIFAFASQFSLGAGILSWAIFTGMLWLQGERSVLRWLVFLICAGVGAYFLLSIPTVQASLAGDGFNLAPLSFPERISRWVGYTLAFIGSVFTGSGWDSVPQATAFGTMGVMVLAGIVFYLWRTRITFREMSPWLGIALFGLGSAMLTAIGRERWLENITPLPVNLRYTPHALYLWLGLIGLSSLIWGKARQRGVMQFIRLARYMALIVLIAIGTLQFRMSAAVVDTLNKRDTNFALCPYVYALSGNTQCLAELVFNGDEEMVQAQMDKLLKYQLSAYSHPPSQPIPLSEMDTNIAFVTIPSHLPFSFEWQVNATLPKGCQSSANLQLIAQTADGLRQTLASGILSPQASQSTLRAPLDKFKGGPVQLTVEAASSQTSCATDLLLYQSVAIH